MNYSPGDKVAYNDPTHPSHGISGVISHPTPGPGNRWTVIWDNPSIGNYSCYEHELIMQ